ncbi:helix-turn-helix domain-containing protein [bacterium]|nr:helix-turn-helix domain-containing protein [bacterium]
MAKKWSEVRKKMPQKAQRESERLARGMIQEIEALHQLRTALNLTQEQIAELVETSQANISKLEKQSDMHVSTLKRYVSALGGKLKLVAEVDGKDYMINQFETD